MAGNDQSHSLPVYDAHHFTTSWDTEDLLGCGSFAVVRKCTHRNLGHVVVKCFCSTGSDESCSKAMRELQREAQILAKLEHKHIVRVFGITMWANCVGFVLELVTNGNLEDLLMSQSIKHIAWELRLQFSKEISTGLAYLHSRKVVHGDLKPQNVLLGKNLSVKLADFGAAEIFKTTKTFDCTLLKKRNTQCTPIYTAPEYLKNPSQAKTTEMDIYSTAILIYEIITRHSAFSGVQHTLVIMLITENGLKPEETIISDVGSTIEELAELEIFEALKNLMTQGWDRSPINRPTASRMNEILKNEFEKVNKAKLASVIRQVLNQRHKKLSKCGSSSKILLSKFSPPFREATKPEDEEVVSYSRSLSSSSQDCGKENETNSCAIDKIRVFLKLESGKLQRHLEEKKLTNYLDPDTLNNLRNIKQETSKACCNSNHGRNAAELMASLSLGQVFRQGLEVLSHDSGFYPVNEIEQVCFEEIREILCVASRKSFQFCEEIQRCGLLTLLVNDLVNLKSLFKDNVDLYGYYVMQAIDIIEKCSRNPKTLDYIQSLNLLVVIKWYIKNTVGLKVRGDQSLVFRFVCVLCYTVGETNLKWLSLKHETIDYCIQFLVESIRSSSYSCGFTSLEIIYRLQSLTSNKRNSKKMADNKEFISLVGEILTTGEHWQKVYCVNLLHNLSKVDENREKIAKKNIVKGLIQLGFESPVFASIVNQVISSIKQFIKPS